MARRTRFKHKSTQEPWTIYDDGPCGSDVIMANIDGERYDIAYISNDPSERRPLRERRANALLIKAAPEMKQLLADMIAEIEDKTTEKGVSLDSYFERRVREVLKEAGVI